MEKNWWKGKVAYQIYPKSFNDSNNDGVGDLKGITEKLDYLQDLGIDILWLSPVYKSPFVDQGYDIADYYAIDPIFGTMDDMDELIMEAKKRGISIIMDLVINHCSDQHEWFQKALADPNGEYAEYFYFVESENGVPNNWRSYFGGSVWDKVPGTNKYYLHSFHKAQPDLNWQNPVVREKLFNMVNWWLEKGIAGFRVDAIMNIKKDLSWSSLPSDGEEDGLVTVDEVLAYAQPIEPFLTELKEKTFDRYNAFTVGEVFDETGDELQFLIGENGMFSSIFDFRPILLDRKGKRWYTFEQSSANALKETIYKTHKLTDSIGILSTIIENHDEARGATRFIPAEDISDTSKKALATLQILRKGIPFIYQGQEIGMENQTFDTIQEYDDINTINEYHVAISDGLTDEDALHAVQKYSRDNARTPMQWTDQEYFGFSQVKPWLLSSHPNRQINVASQINDATSVLSYYKKLTALYRHALYGESIRSGVFRPVYESVDHLIAYERVGDRRVQVLINFSNQEQRITLEEAYTELLVNNLESINQGGLELYLEPYQALVLGY
ncbi:alpha-glucosidase [Streptococcus cuniculi]|uniref:Alpha-glucosidase n=1 Tax=Streptococcus cuniculi TaxID=1432788 RepID=A0A4Y9JFX5_9STRE|nr:alpha-glucosidase [Streptococcus cuniculi]MBF0777324.1 alpha-glucosidase [Streptococcus cuniculi]TFU98926.1 alpha-glucosidase [Streptococcus cuniculi]